MAEKNENPSLLEKKEAESLDPASQSLAEALNLSLKILKGIMILLVILFLSSGIFTVEQNQEAMVLRFGKIQGSLVDRVLKPGLHWTWPYPFSEVIKVPTHEIKLMDGESDIMNDFWYQEDIKATSKVETLDPEFDGYCLTGDVNIIHCRWQLRYLITDTYLYHVKHSDCAKVIHSVICNCILKVISNCTIPEDAVLGNLIDKIGPEVKKLAQNQLDSLETGIEIQGFAVVQVVPPRQVQEVFDSVLKAKAEQDRKIAEANNYYEQLINRAIGEKAEIIAKADNYALQIQKEAESDASYFKSLLLSNVDQSPIFRERHYQQIVEKLNEKLQEIFLFANKVSEREVRIHLNRNPDLYRIQAPKED